MTVQETDSEGDDEEDSADAFLREVARIPTRKERRSEPDLTGHMVGPYRIESMLGQGGMGIVYAARDTKLDRDVALKLLPIELGEDADRRRRFLREARAAAAIRHPSIAMVYEVGEAERRLFIAMERVRGLTLRAVLDDFPQGMPLEKAARIGRDLARGLGAAHAMKIVHRDVKPENVIVGEGDAVKILDFGLAKLGGKEAALASTATQAGAVLGTPSYMAPEQTRGGDVRPETDVYALGVVLHELVRGTRPSIGVAVELRGAWGPIVRRCLAVDPLDRFANGDEVAEALESVSGPRRGSRRTAVLAGVAAVAVGGVALLWNMESRSPEAPRARSDASSFPVVASASSAASSPMKESAATSAGGLVEGSASSPLSAVAVPEPSISVSGPPPATARPRASSRASVSALPSASAKIDPLARQK